MKKLLYYLRDYRRECILGPLFKMLEAVFELFVPLVVASMIDRGIGGADRGHILRMSLLMVLLAAIGLSCTLFAQFFAAKAAVGVSARLRHEMLARIQRMRCAELDKQGSATLITRMTGDIAQVQTGVNLAIRLLLRSPFIVFGAMVMAFTVDVKAALVFVAVIPLLSAVVFGIMLVTIPRYQQIQQQLDTVTDLTRENLSGVRAVRAFRLEQPETERFNGRLSVMKRMQKAVGGIAAMMNPGTYILVNGAVIALLYIGAIRVNSGTLTQGAVIALYNYMSQILVELIKLANLLIALNKTAACWNRITPLLDPDAEAALAAEHDAAENAVLNDCTVVFDRVSFTYEGSSVPALSDVSFTAKRGDVIGIIGGTGAGKTTLVNLIPGFYDVTEGTLTVGGTKVQDIPAKLLRSRIGVVPQKALLFSGSIRDNLRWGNPDATDGEITEALRTAQALDVIASKEGGLDEPILEGGRNLSGGQRQRLTIARALVRRPDILILDDSASALDYATDAALRKALRALPGAPTVFIVSQRTSSICHADQILVLEHGSVAGIGTHQELLESCAVYREIYDSQFPQEVQ